jgi:hypothetical protein
LPACSSIASVSPISRGSDSKRDHGYLLHSSRGVLLYSYGLWLLLWAGLHVALRRKEAVGTLPDWGCVFLGATLVAFLIA